MTKVGYSQNDKIWLSDPSVEQRTFDRCIGKLPEMESAKQLRSILSNIYQPNSVVLDAGCAAGHYLNSLLKIDKSIHYIGIDLSDVYINFASSHFKDLGNVSFSQENLYELPARFTSIADISYSCNVFLHLPSLYEPLKSLIGTSKKYVVIRSLFAQNTHLSKFLYSDRFNDSLEPLDYVHQNTWSFDYFEKCLMEISPNATYEIIDDIYDPTMINAEYASHNEQQSAVTKSRDGVQFAGSKVFEWKWILIKINR